MSKVSITVNGKATSAMVEDRMLLVDYLREERNLTGTHVGCDTSQCGACLVMVDGKSVKACTMLAVQADGSEVTTIEGIASGGELHPMQAAFRENHGLQCGFCTPGMIMTGIDMVNRLGTARRKDHPRTAGRQYLPLHRLSQHRQKHRRRCGCDGRRHEAGGGMINNGY